jgi:predicted hotdog family 3-hydroxylacyl-ACP dehydratase
VIARAEIAQLIPHAGRMCLIDRVPASDNETIDCEADSHRDPEHPLRRGGALASVHLIEYGAQAAAIHAALHASDRQRVGKGGWLVSVRDCKLHVDRLDDLPLALEIRARREGASREALAYSFAVSHDRREIGRGRLMIRLAAAL